MSAHKITIAVVEDEEDQRNLVANLLTRSGYQIKSCANIQEVKKYIDNDEVEIVFSDWKLNQEDGLEIHQYIKQKNKQTGFILATGHGSISHAVEAMRTGIDDYLVKPYQKEQLLFAIEKVIKAKSLIEENQKLLKNYQEKENLVDLIGRSKEMQILFQKIEKMAPTNATILISGESGTGKELTASALHQLSSRKQKPFVALNCASIPESLAEAEFFGSEKGSFTGSTGKKQGKFEYAHEGTIFLDEIGEMPLPLQAKLLRLIQEKKMSRIGSNQEIEIDVRIIAATNRNLEKEIKAGKFREDLFYRLNVLPIELPPLRERIEDIPLLSKHFVDSLCKRYQMESVQLSSSAINKLMAYRWPGNVRELSNVIERLVLLTHDGNIDLNLIPETENLQQNDEFSLPEQGLDWDAHEKAILQQALIRSAGNKTKAARLLNLSYKTFLYRLEKVLK